MFSSKRQSSPQYRHCFLLILLCLVFLCNTACSPSKSEGVKIRLGYLQSDLHHLPAFVAIEKGYFQQEGLAVEVIGAFRAGPELISAFSAQALDAGYVGLAPAITAKANSTAHIQCVALVNTEGSAIVTGKEASGKSVADLKGKVVTIPGHATMQDFLLRRALKQQGVAVNEIKLLVLKPPEMIPALSRKDIDAFIAWEPYPSKAVTENAGRILMTSHQIWAQHPCCVIVADEEFCGKHPEMVQKLKSVHRRSCEFINASRPEAIAIGVNYTGMDGKTVAAALGSITYGGVLERQYVAEYVDFLRELRYIRPDIAKDFLMSILPEQ